MASKVFSTKSKNKVKAANCVNEAGGLAYKLEDEAALAQYVATGCFNNTFYASAGEQVDNVLELAKGCSTEFVAKLAVYARKSAKMKDSPALLLNVLANRGQEGLKYLRKVFNTVITDVKMLRNFVQILRSGKCGRKSFGYAIKALIKDWLASKTPDYLFKGSIGTSPSLADVIRMVHPKPENEAKNHLYKWLLDKDYKVGKLSPVLKSFEKFKKDNDNPVPDVEFRMLTSLNLTKDQWYEVAKNSSWNALRMNLNNFAGKLEYDNGKLSVLANRLKDREEVLKNNVFPYEILAAYLNIHDEMPNFVKNALQEAMEVATSNVPAFNCQGVAVAVDVSGSMSSAVTGGRGSATSKMRCVDVAALFASAILRRNKDAVVVPFDTAVRSVDINPFDAIMTNAAKLSINGGGTTCSVALKHLNQIGHKGDLVIYVSDNMSWRDYQGGSGTEMASQWKKYKGRNKNAKLVLIDVQPYSSTQVSNDKDVLNVGGFNDSVFNVISSFLETNDKDGWVNKIKEITLE